MKSGLCLAKLGSQDFKTALYISPKAHHSRQEPSKVLALLGTHLVKPLILRIMTFHYAFQFNVHNSSFYHTMWRLLLY